MITWETAKDDARQISVLLSRLPGEWDGKAAIREMKERDCQWRQLEWIGFYGEILVRDRLAGHLRIPGRRYGNVTFDAFSHFNWDIKVHPNNQTTAILNDREATDLSIREFGYHGLIVLCVDCEYDTDGFFKVWHDALKGGISVYEKERLFRGASSRIRKTKARLSETAIILLDEVKLQSLGFAQKGWRNADGSPRREKYAISHSLIEEFGRVLTLA